MVIWIEFFLEMLKKQKDNLYSKLEKEHELMKLPELSAAILREVKSRGTASISELETLTKANRNTIKGRLRELVKDGMLEMIGKGKGVRYKIK
jgi:predicted HTH transcriptional regulator